MSNINNNNNRYEIIIIIIKQARASGALCALCADPMSTTARNEERVFVVICFYARF